MAGRFGSGRRFDRRSPVTAQSRKDNDSSQISNTYPALCEIKMSDRALLLRSLMTAKSPEIRGAQVEVRLIQNSNYVASKSLLRSQTRCAARGQIAHDGI